MSATNRGAERVAEDAYPTPAWCVRRLVDGLLEMYPAIPRLGRWHEVCAGDAAIIRAIDDTPLRPGRWIATEIRESLMLAELEQSGRIETLRMLCDFLTAPPVDAEVIVTNPPFSIAFDIIKKALTEAPWVITLLRMNFKGSKDRADWLRSEMPDELGIPNRPSFIVSYTCAPRDDHDRGCGWALKLPVDAPKIKLCPECGRKVDRCSSDSAEYGWFVWTPERGRRVGRSMILPLSSDEERGVNLKRKKAAA